MKALFFPLLVHQTLCMRLDLDDLRGSTSPESNNGKRLPISLVVAVGREKCTNFIDSKLDRDAHFLKEGDFLINDIGNTLDTLAETTTGYYAYFKNFRTYLTQNTHHVRNTFNYVAFDSVEYKFYLQQLSDDTTRYASHFRDLPANRMYALVVGQVERGDDDDTNHFTEAREACTGDVKIEMQLLIDQWATGDDLTAWPSEATTKPMHNSEVIYSEDSTVYARIGNIKLDGQVGTLLGKSSAQKAYWILDITYVDRLDLVVSNPIADKRLSGGAGVRDGKGFTRGTWWWAFEGDHHTDIDVQADWIRDSRSNSYLCLITDTGKLAETIKDGPKNPTQHDSLPYDADGDRCVSYNNGKKCTCGNQNLFGEEWTWSDSTHRASRVLPVVACGLFNKVWKSKSCLRNIKKGESQGESQG